MLVLVNLRGAVGGGPWRNRCGGSEGFVFLGFSW